MTTTNATTTTATSTTTTSSSSSSNNNNNNNSILYCNVLTQQLQELCQQWDCNGWTDAISDYWWHSCRWAETMTLNCNDIKGAFTRSRFLRHAISPHLSRIDIHQATPLQSTHKHNKEMNLSVSYITDHVRTKRISCCCIAVWKEWKEEKEKNIMGTSNTGHTTEYWCISRAT
jgi:hypothetical protein